MDNIIIQDVCETFIKDKTNDKMYYFGLVGSNEVNQTVEQTMLRAGIGSGVFATLQNNKEITFSVTPEAHADSAYEMQSGTDFTSESYGVYKQETKELVSGAFAIDGTPENDTVVVVDKNNKTIDSTYATGEVTVTSGVEGEYYTVLYTESVSGEVLDLASDKFPKNYEVHLHTIAYDPDTNIVVADVYWVFTKALPNGEISATFDNGENNNETISFTAQLEVGSKSYGKYLVVPRT